LFGQVAAIILHDYVGTILVLLWLYVFWKIANQYLLTSKEEEEEVDESASAFSDVEAPTVTS